MVTVRAVCALAGFFKTKPNEYKVPGNVDNWGESPDRNVTRRPSDLDHDAVGSKNENGSLTVDIFAYCWVFFCQIKASAGLSAEELPIKPDSVIRENGGSATLEANVTEKVFSMHGSGEDCTIVPTVNDGHWTVRGCKSAADGTCIVHSGRS